MSIVAATGTMSASAPASASASASASGGAGAEEVTLGDIDPIDEFCVVSIFDEASRYLSGHSKIKLSSEQKLQFYALFKQATVGACTKPKPGLLEMVERAKWTAWHSLGKMKKEAAIAEYVRLLDSVAPQWRQELGDLQHSDEDDDKDDDGGGGGGGAGLTISPSLSRPVIEKDTAPVSATDIFYFANEGSVGKFQSVVDQKVNLTQTNSEGQNVLHLAVDRGHLYLVKFLLKHGELASQLISHRDNDGLTPLHFACVCEHSEIAALLVKSGADPAAANSDGETCWELASLLVSDAMKQAQHERSSKSD